MCPSHNPRKGRQYLLLFPSLKKTVPKNFASVGKKKLLFFFKLNQVGRVYFIILNNKIRVAFGAMFGFLKQKLLKILNQFGFTSLESSRSVTS